MPSIPPVAREHLSQSLLGRLRLKAFEIITGQKDIQPVPAVRMRWMLDQFRANWEAGLIWHALLTIEQAGRVSISKLPPAKRLVRALEQLDSNPQVRPQFIELKGANPLSVAREEIIGVLVRAESLEPSGHVYVMTFFSEESFPNARGRLEVRASRANPDPAFSVLTKDGFVHYSQSEYGRSEVTRLAARVLSYLADNPRRQWKPIPMSAARFPRMPKDLIPPRDVRLEKLIHDVAARRIKLYCTRVPLETITPSNLDFALNYRIDAVERLIRHVDQWDGLALLLYWNGSKFVMSDDYTTYLAHRKMKTAVVPCVILGAYPSEIARPEREGYMELMPSAVAVQTSHIESLNDDLKTWLLDSRLLGRRFEPPQVLIDAFLRLASLLHDPKVTERQIHDALREQPFALQPSGVDVQSEVRLGTQFRVDLAIRDDAFDRSTILVELEHPRDKIFDRFGRLRKKVTHASQQVEDWLRWWREHPADVPRGFRTDLTPEGLVVIGRDACLDGELKTRLEHLNQNRRVRIVTYDDLLRRLTSLIVKLGQTAT